MVKILLDWRKFGGWGKRTLELLENFEISPKIYINFLNFRERFASFYIELLLASDFSQILSRVRMGKTLGEVGLGMKEP